MLDFRSIFEQPAPREATPVYRKVMWGYRFALWLILSFDVFVAFCVLYIEGWSWLAVAHALAFCALWTVPYVIFFLCRRKAVRNLLEFGTHWEGQLESVRVVSRPSKGASRPKPVGPMFEVTVRWPQDAAGKLTVRFISQSFRPDKAETVPVLTHPRTRLVVLFIQPEGVLLGKGARAKIVET